jgi:hypothetical protein
MNQEKKRLHTGEFNGIIIDMKKECDINKKNHTITITNKYDPNVDYYRERETRWQQKKIHLKKLEKKLQT